MTVKTQAYLQGYLHEKTAMVAAGAGAADPGPPSPPPTRNPALRSYYDLLLAIKRGDMPQGFQLSQLALKEGPVGEWNVKRERKPIEQWAKENSHLYRGGPEYQGGLESKKLWEKTPVGGWSDSALDSVEDYA